MAVMRTMVAAVVLAGCGLPELTSEDVFGREANPHAWVYGTVVDASSKAPIAEATVQLARGTTTTDANGAFRIDGIAVGDGELEVSKEGYAVGGYPVRIHAGGNRLELPLTAARCSCGGGQACDFNTGGCVPEAIITGVIVDACTGAALVAKITVNGVSGCAVDVKGYWEVRGLSPGGPQTLVAGYGGYQPYTTKVTLKSGFNAIDKISLERVGGCGAVPPSWVCR